ncbi:MAG: molybdenum cofactor guanylyltransferase [Synechococcales cyanobacterium CRU_2_2]|nr:molybdenum cofactor guanylyltransferase [Synechococcales cyanobacterium CRU_2_2]
MRLEALILAGGNSTRMGQDKALLRRSLFPDSQTLLAQICQVAIAQCDRVFVLTPRTVQYQSLLPPGCVCLPESRPASAPPPGPLVAFAEGLAQLPCDWVLLLACDLPALTAQTLGEWRALLPQAQPETLALLPRGPKGWEPLCGFYRRRALISLEEAIAQGQRSFQGWLATVEVEALPLESMAPIQNCNTPAEWQRFQHWDARAWDARA